MAPSSKLSGLTLREIKEHAEQGDVAWLTNKGKVYAAVEAA